MRTAWRAPEILLEALLNLALGRWRTLSAITAIAFATAGVLVYTVTTLDELADREEKFISAGGYITLVEVNGHIEGGSCEQLADSPFIEGSGTYSERDDFGTLARSPSIPFGVYDVSFGAIEALSGEGVSLRLPSQGEMAVPAVFGGALAAELGLEEGEKTAVVIDDDTVYVQVVGVLQSSERSVTFERSALLVYDSRGMRSTCVVEGVPGLDADLLAAAPPSLRSRGEISTRAFVPDTFGPTPSEQLAMNNKLAAPAAASTIVTLYLLGWCRSRRNDVAVYRLSGSSRLEASCMIGLEGLMLCIWGSAVGLTVGSSAAWTQVEATDAVWKVGVASALAVGAASAVVAIVGASLLARSSVAEWLKDRE